MAAKTPKTKKAKSKAAKAPPQEAVEAKAPRQLKAPKYSSFKLQKRFKEPRPKLPNAFKIFRASLGVLVRNWKVFLGIVLVYGVLNIVLVRGFSADGGALDQVKSIFSDMFKGGIGNFIGGTAMVVYLLTSSGNLNSDVSAAYQMFLALIVSLALIWTLRQVHAQQKIRIRDGFYRGMYPLIPFILVLLVVALQCIPFAVGGYVYSTVLAGGTITSGPENLLWAFLFFLCALATIYMLCSSLFALYIVCLPDMTPRRALKAARELVRHRRWMIMRKVVFLPFALVVLAGIVMVPLILFAQPVAPWVFFLLSMLSIAVLHSYMYKLYRELI